MAVFWGSEKTRVISILGASPRKPHRIEVFEGGSETGF
jgi:hypothetical protein